MTGLESVSKYIYFGNSGFFRSLYLRWKALRKVPFRKRFLIGTDLEGNTFWEWRNLNNPGRQRRMVELRTAKRDYVDYKLPPQWNQWLRHVRIVPPTIEELMQDEARIAGIQAKIQAAEKRWKSVPLKQTPVGPGSVSPQGMPGSGMLNTDARPAGATSSKSTPQAPASGFTTKKERTERKREDGTINLAVEEHSAGGAEFQPQAWQSKPIKRD
ncbi:uncharacterized protein V1513DRAFT_423656 [Lipomyces chichibuensis]|uniref:uncharacterized protein n=1 Tax=Lipomyces chichibuensis TaxID=1546026 RepID=UPI003343BB55